MGAAATDSSGAGAAGASPLLGALSMKDIDAAATDSSGARADVSGGEDEGMA